jgi:hypothetical protein
MTTLPAGTNADGTTVAAHLLAAAIVVPMVARRLARSCTWSMPRPLPEPSQETPFVS